MRAKKLANLACPSFKKITFASFAVAMLVGMAPANFALSADNDPDIDCSGSANDPITYAVCICNKRQQDIRRGTTAITVQNAAASSYLNDFREKQPGDPNSLQTASGGQYTAQMAQSCYSATKSAFDSFLGSAGSFFGFDVGSLLGGVVNQMGGNMCNQLNQAISSRLQMSCPRVSIPGFPVNCRGGVSVNSNGIQLYGGGTFGGWNANGSTNTGVNGVTTGGGSYYGGQGNSGYGNVNTGTQQGGSGIFGTVSNSVSCWFSGSNC